MGRFLPKAAKPVEAFHWKSNWAREVALLIAFLDREGWEFELYADGVSVSILIGDPDGGHPHTHEKVEDGNWVVFDGELLYVYRTTADFREAYSEMTP